MGRRETVVHVGSSSSGEWYLATRSDVVQFYCFELPDDPASPMTYTIIPQLDRTKLVAAGNKATAQHWAKRLGLTSWTYVRM